jgi:peptidoglycan hydrolase FlgJ
VTDLRAPSPATLKLAGTVSTDTTRLGTRDNLDKAGEQFEAIFTKMMLASMRKAKLADSLFESQALDQFRDMQDQKHTPMGIGKAMTAFLAKTGSVAETAPAAPAEGKPE